MPLGQQDPGATLTAGGTAPKTTIPEFGWTAEAESDRARDPYGVGPADYWAHRTITAAELNAGVQVIAPVPIVAYQLAVFEAITVLVGHGVEPRNEPGNYDTRHPGLGELTRHIPPVTTLHLLAPNGNAADNVELYVAAGRIAARF